MLSLAVRHLAWSPAPGGQLEAEARAGSPLMRARRPYAEGGFLRRQARAHH
jgi:hypothetical protein